MSNDSNSPRTGSLHSMGEAMQATRGLIQRAASTASSTTSPRDEDETRSALPAVGSDAGERGAIATHQWVANAVLKAFGLPVQEATLARSLAPLIAWGDKSLFGDHGYEGTAITDVVVRPGADPTYVTQCLGKIEVLCAPCGAQHAARKLTELRMLTAHRARDGEDVELMAAAYTSRIAQYPADVVEAACDAWSNANQFWPTWAELKDHCDKRMRGRTQIREALLKAARS